jgi:hypothetical protein
MKLFCVLPKAVAHQDFAPKVSGANLSISILAKLHSGVTRPGTKAIR